tara:strand:- start:13406 stop:13690 length:285 start_codon:yes stop_codon:yes gene_type:complete
MYVKIHETENKDIVAVCDEDLIGKKFEEKELILDVSEEFYKGEKMDEKRTLEIMKKADILNIVGEKSIDLASKNDIVSKMNIIKIKGIPHAQVF